MDQSIGMMMSVYLETHDNDEIILCCKAEPASGNQVFDIMYCYELMITNPEVRLPPDALKYVWCWFSLTLFPCVGHNS
jgi:hypothetical protein